MTISSITEKIPRLFISITESKIFAKTFLLWCCIINLHHGAISLYAIASIFMLQSLSEAIEFKKKTTVITEITMLHFYQLFNTIKYRLLQQTDRVDELKNLFTLHYNKFIDTTEENLNIVNSNVKKLRIYIVQCLQFGITSYINLLDGSFSNYIVSALCIAIGIFNTQKILNTSQIDSAVINNFILFKNNLTKKISNPTNKTINIHDLIQVTENQCKILIPLVKSGTINKFSYLQLKHIFLKYDTFISKSQDHHSNTYVQIKNLFLFYWLELTAYATLNDLEHTCNNSHYQNLYQNKVMNLVNKYNKKDSKLLANIDFAAKKVDFTMFNKNILTKPALYNLDL